MKIGRILFFVSALLLANGSVMQAGPSEKQKKEAAKTEVNEDVPALDVDKQLQYCHKQVARALAELKQKDGSYDYTMEPRNILKDDKQKGWNCRKATPEEWCDGFWPGILWMDYQISHDNAVRTAAEGYTNAL